MKQLKTLSIICAVTFLMSGALLAQSGKVLMKQGDDLMLDKKYYDAIERYEEAAQDEDLAENPALANSLANAYWLARDYKKAEKWFKKASELSPETNVLAGYYYAEALHMNGKYKSAQEAYKTFSKSKGLRTLGIEAQKWKKRCKSGIAGCKFALANLTDSAEAVVVHHMRKGINSYYTEFAPLPTGKKTLVYSALKSNEDIILDPKSKEPEKLARFYTTKMVSENQWTDGKPLDGPFNDKNMHTGAGSYSPDKRRFYYTKCKLNAEQNLNCNIYVSERTAEGWTKGIKLNSVVNAAGSSSTSPSVATSKKGFEILYFVSDRAGGEGGKDIWFTKISKKGEFEKAINCGRRINTSGDDATPFYDVKTSTLYFSSNGMAGFGGMDIYKSKGGEKRFAKAKNVGVPFNSSYDDMYYSEMTNGRGGFFVSNRPGILGLKSETCCDDIFYFEIIQPVLVSVKGSVTEFVDSVSTAGTKSSSDISTNAIVALSVVDPETGVENIVEYDTLSKKRDYFFFDLILDQNYKITATSPGFLSGSGNLTTFNITETDTLSSNLELTKVVENKILNLKNVYFDFDSPNLKPTSYKTLDSLANFLVTNDNLKVELGAHTDSKGSEEYNQTLSQKRAESVVSYLAGKGVQSERMTAVGYGESRPIAANENPDGSDNPEGRAKNRRTEVKLLGVVQGVDIIYKDRRFKELEVENEKEEATPDAPDEQPE